MQLSINWKRIGKKNRTSQIDLSYSVYVCNLVLPLIMIAYHQTR